MQCQGPRSPSQHLPGDHDVLAAYCPGTDGCCYLRAPELPEKQATLRILDTRNGQKLGVRSADNVTEPLRVFRQPP